MSDDRKSKLSPIAITDFVWLNNYAVSQISHIFAMLKWFVWLSTLFEAMTTRQLNLVLSCDLKKERERRGEKRGKGRWKRMRK